MRTFMTTFGIVWGTAAVSLLLAFGQGFHEQVYKSSAGLGENICIAWPSRTSLPFQGLGKGRRIRLDEDDMQLIRAKADDLEAISSEYEDVVQADLREEDDGGRRSRRHAGLRVDAHDRPARGRTVDQRARLGRRRRVAFLGDELAETVFGTADPVGKTINMNGSPFLVIGVMVKKPQDSSYSGRDKDNVFIPGTTHRALTGAEVRRRVHLQGDPGRQDRGVEDAGARDRGRQAPLRSQGQGSDRDLGHDRAVPVPEHVHAGVPRRSSESSAR